MSTEATNPNSVISVGQAIGATLSTALAVAFPEEKIIMLALQAFLREAPSLYLDFVSILSKKDRTPEETSDFNSKVTDLLNPENFYAQARARAAAPASDAQLPTP